MAAKRTTTKGSKSKRSTTTKASKSRRYSSGRAIASAFEALESRQLMSTVNVGDFGAVANDGRDDTAAIRAAIASARGGDTIQFGNGRYDVNSTINAGSGLTFNGNRGQTLIRSADKAWAFNVTNGNTGTFKNLNFDGSAIGAEGRSTLNVDWIDVTNFTRGVNVGFGAGTALGGHGSAWDPVNSKITNSSFHDSPGGWGIGFYKGSGLTIADNAFVNITNGIKSNNVGNTAHDITITRNYFSGIRRMFAELQGQVQNFELSDNYVENPVLAGSFSQNNDCLGFSVIYHGDETRNARVVRNTILCPQRPDGTGVRLAFEIGNNFTVEDNYINGIGTMTSCFMGDSSGPRSEAEIGHTYVRNNKMVDARWGQGGSYGQYPRNASYSNNNANVQLSWNINRGKPGPGRTFGGGTPTPDPVPDPTPEPIAFGITGTVQANTTTGTVKVSLDNLPEGTAKVRFEPRASRDWSVTDTRVGPTTTLDVAAAKSATLSGYHPGWEVDLRAVALDANGKVLGTTGWASLSRFPGDSTIAWPITKPEQSDKMSFKGEVQGNADDGTLKLWLEDVPTSVVSVRIEPRATRDWSVTDSRVGQTYTLTREQALKPMLLSGYHPGWEVDLRVVALDASGKVVSTLDWFTLPRFPGDSTVAWPKAGAPTPEPTPVPTPVPTPTSTPRKHVALMNPGEVENAWGLPEVNESNGGNGAGDGQTMSIAGRTFSRGFGVTAGSKLSFDLHKKWDTFTTYVGLDDEIEGNGTVKFQVWGDGELLAESATVGKSTAASKLVVDVQGVRHLWLVVTDATGASNATTHADWARPILQAA